MTDYTRQSSFSNGDVIDATQLNAEFDQLVAAFVQATGHRHDAAGEGGYVPLIADDAGVSSVKVDKTDPANHKIIFTLDGTEVLTYSETDGLVSTTTNISIEELNNVGNPVNDGYFRWNSDGTAVIYSATIPLVDLANVTETNLGYWKYNADATAVEPVTTIPHTDITGLITANIDHRGVTLDSVLDDFDSRVTDAGADAAAAAASAAEAETAATRAENAAMQTGIPIFVSDGATVSAANQEAVEYTFLGAGTLVLPTTVTQGNRMYIRSTLTADDADQITLQNSSLTIVGSKETVPAGTDLIMEKGQLLVLEAISTTQLEII